jgi:hypothetical protein
MNSFRAYDPDQLKLSDYEEGSIDTVLKTPSNIINGMWHIWSCRRPMGKYKGAYPTGFLKRVYELISQYQLVPNFNPKKSMILHQFGGTTPKSKNEHTVDINPDVEPVYLTDARTLTDVPDNTYDIVIGDPPYDNFVDIDIMLEYLSKYQPTNKDLEFLRDMLLQSFANEKDYSTRLYNCEPVKPYSFVNAGLRVLKPGGVYLILHQLSYITPMKNLSWSDYDTERILMIGVTTGPNMVGRLLNGFRKQRPESTTQELLS